MFFPVVCSDIGKDNSDSWTGLNSDGAACLKNVREVYRDDDLQELVYAVDIEFIANEYQRYPIELFGMVSVFTRKDFGFSVPNDNGIFAFDKLFRPEFTGLLRAAPKTDGETFLHPRYLDFITHCQISSGLDGISGSITMDGYPLSQGLKVMRQEQSIGEIDLAVQIGDKSSHLFSGYAMEINTNDSEGSYSISAKLAGIDRKMSDMKLFCAPFWDGDRLEAICAYFEEYLKLQFKMIDHEVRYYSNAKPVYTNIYASTGTWHASSDSIVPNDIKHPDFRMPRSVDWRSPAINFVNGTVCLDALKQIGEKCSCTFCPQLDGTGTFYEINLLGYPYYVDNQLYIVEFDASDVISFNLAPYLDNKYNSIATFGFLQKRDSNGRVLTNESVHPGVFYNRTNGSDGYDIQQVGVQFPWSRPSIKVENGMYTLSELEYIHKNRIRMMTSEIYQGSMTVPGNTRVYHLYQRIAVAGIPFFVISIDHDLDLQNKTWTTSYGIQYINVMEGGGLILEEGGKP